MRYHMAAFFGGFLLDLILGDPYVLPHPVRLIGRMIAGIEKRVLKQNYSNKKKFYLGTGIGQEQSLYCGKAPEARATTARLDFS